MKKELKLSSNDNSVWLDEPEEVYKDMDVVEDTIKLKEISKESPIVHDLIEMMDCSLIVDSTNEYWPFSNN